MFHGIGSDFQIQRKKRKLFFTNALNTCNKCIRVQRDMHRAVTELSDILIEGFISKFLHVYLVNNIIFRVSGNSSLQRLHSFHPALNRSSPSFHFPNSWPLQLKEHYFHKKKCTFRRRQGLQTLKTLENVLVS